jgi:hypothetical protein
MALRKAAVWAGVQTATGGRMPDAYLLPVLDPGVGPDDGAGPSGGRQLRKAGRVGCEVPGPDRRVQGGAQGCWIRARVAEVSGFSLLGAGDSGEHCLDIGGAQPRGRDGAQAGFQVEAHVRGVAADGGATPELGGWPASTAATGRSSRWRRRVPPGRGRRSVLACGVDVAADVQPVLGGLLAGEPAGIFCCVLRGRTRRSLMLFVGQTRVS